ncbi:MAG: winged helix-turn-helix domain-containing protein [Methanobacteriota archaeon]
MRWARVVEKEGVEGLRARKAKGGPALLTDPQRDRLRAMLLEGACAHGFATDIWTGKRVSALVLKEFGIKYCWKYVPQLLQDQLGFSWQKPDRQPREIDPVKVETWLRTVWAPVKKGRSKGAGPSGSWTSPARA